LFPYGMGVNPVTNKIYVPNLYSNNVTVIDGATNTTTTVAVGGGPAVVAVNPVTNKIYVVNEFSSNVTVIDGATDTTTTVAAGTSPIAEAVNPVTNKIYVADFLSNNVTVIDGATNTTTTVAGGPVVVGAGVAVNPVTNKIYVANACSYNVTVIAEQQVQRIPLANKVKHLAGNMTTNPTPTFTFSAKNMFAPIAPAVDGLYFQVDTWQGPWRAAHLQNPLDGFRGRTHPLLPGVHILYAYATDGQDGTSTMTTQVGGSSPLVGEISAYLFVVVP
jgi:YVTN family beta-propeller protein